jgi:hypothetical protein
MTPGQFHLLAVIIMSGICLLGIGSKAVAGVFKYKQKLIKLKKVLSKNEIEKKKIELQESVLNNAINALKELATCL